MKRGSMMATLVASILVATLAGQVEALVATGSAEPGGGAGPLSTTATSVGTGIGSYGEEPPAAAGTATGESTGVHSGVKAGTATAMDEGIGVGVVEPVGSDDGAPQTDTGIGANTGAVSGTGTDTDADTGTTSNPPADPAAGETLPIRSPVNDRVGRNLPAGAVAIRQQAVDYVAAHRRYLETRAKRDGVDAAARFRDFAKAYAVYRRALRKAGIDYRNPAGASMPAALGEAANPGILPVGTVEPHAGVPVAAPIPTEGLPSVGATAPAGF